MVLLPQLSKTTLLTSSTTTYAAPIYQVVSPPTYKPIAFSDVDKYMAWHGAMREKVKPYTLTTPGPRFLFIFR